MSSGAYISTVAHLVLILWAFIGFRPSHDPQPVEIQDISIVSQLQLEGLLLDERVQSPLEVEAPPPLSDAPADAALDTLTPPAPQDRPNTAQSESISQPEEEIAPDVSQVVTIPQADVTDSPPDSPLVPEGAIAPLVSETVTPIPQAATRIAPTPIAPSAPENQFADTSQPAVESSEQGEQSLEEQELQQPKEAANEIVTEAETPATNILEQRPVSRPPNARPVESPAPEADPQVAQNETDDAIRSALEGLLARREDTPETTQVTSRLSQSERDTMRLSVEVCWNVGSLSTDALNTIVTVGFDLNPDGRPIAGSVNLISSTGGSGNSIAQAYEAARRAILICGSSGFPLPPEKYEDWRTVEITFNPQQMGLR